MKFGLKTLLAATILTALTGCNSNNATSTAAEHSEALVSAAQNAARSEANRARDQYRNPVATLDFFGLQDGMTVVEIAPGGGWYSEILAPALKGNGTLYAAHFPAESEGYYKRSLDGFKDKVANDARFSEVKITEFSPVTHLDIAPASSADMVLTFRNVHNWYMRGEHQGVLSAFKAFNKALKPGGILGVVEHRLPENRDDAEQKRSGYMKQSYVIEVAKQAGFELVAQSDINANPKDTADHPKGVWTLPPRLALGEEQADKYKAIGESDRMTLKFKKL
ncbi:class I SAM-dependent methyltransferase [Pseudoalteromonas sp. JBTF-M23]|uniref:Class I SAM-dependent methyltransferase n=1 Tax=Pseudoalteromonas caenipelagi TaxID=2726988 RepID=A0A849VDX3_9GAMM|nr:class I SAM-dependent methyltransferase [Pseudoalteromonas caenipelagi]NOU51592.1 class I SAM-dependent methyltransferase [Pseudoalteromonas caenipelagi]